MHEENSSFPSANPTITAIKTGASGESVQIRLSDSSSFFVPPETLAELGLARDMEITEELRTGLERAAEHFAAKRKTLELLARREHSRYELRVKLQKRGFAAEVVEAVLARMSELDIVNDLRFAETWIHARFARKAEGRIKLKSALIRKGVSPGVAERVLGEFFTPEVQRRNIEKATEKALAGCGGDQDKFVRMLKNRGFSWKEIKKHSIFKFIEYY